jgi:hypothetical protein
MGYSSGIQCFSTPREAVRDWCANLQSGSSALSCSGTTGRSATIKYLDSGVYKTVVIQPGTPDCNLPDPISDTAFITGPIVGLWLLAYGSRYLIDMFNTGSRD